MKNKDNLTKGIQLLAETQSQLTLQALAIYEPLVRDIITNKLTSQKQIEQVLDALLGFCSDKAKLLLYRTLCRYYFNLDPQATAEYINLYRELWDEDGKRNFKNDHI